MKTGSKDSHRRLHARPNPPAILFDLDGTLLDSVYQHVASWQQALAEDGISVPGARIHRCVGMGGKLMLRTIFRELGREIGSGRIDRLEKKHQKKFRQSLASIQVLPGTRQLLLHLSRSGIRWAIATGGDQDTVTRMVKPLRLPKATPVITADHVERTKPDPDVFLEAADRLGVALHDCIVVGDSIWDMLGARRAKALGVGLLSGGYGEAELIQAGAYRVYKYPENLLEQIAEIGIPSM